MKRRDFITLTAAATAAPMLGSFGARAQQPMPVIGLLNSEAPKFAGHRLRDFQLGLKEAGFAEGKNVTIEYRWAEGRNDRLPAMAADLVRRRVDVIAANFPGAVAAKAATQTIPIVFTTSSDPVRSGLVSSLSRPGGNITGATQFGVEVGPKRLELLHELAPSAKVVGFLVNPTNPNAKNVADEVQKAAQSLGLTVHVLHASNEHALDAAFARLTELRAGGLVVGADAFLGQRSQRLAALSLHHKMPVVAQSPLFAQLGGLMTYGGSVGDTYRLKGVYAGRILKGERPADLPVQQSTKVEMLLNLKTAKALGITVPLPLLGRADEVIE